MSGSSGDPKRRPVPSRRTGSSAGGHLRILAAVVLAGVVLAGCGGQPARGVAPPAAPSGPPTSTSASAAVSASGATIVGAPDPNAPEVNAAGDIPDNQVFVPFTSSGNGFAVSVPQGWARSAVGAATVFTDKFNSVRIEVSPRAPAPDVATVRAQDVPRLQAETAGFVLGEVRSVSRSAGQAVLTTYAATSAKDAVTGKSVTQAVERYLFWKSGQEAALTLSGPKGADNVDPWRKISDSFRWLR